MRTMSGVAILALAAAGLLMAAEGAAAQQAANPLTVWHTSDKLPEVVKLGVEKDVPIAVIYQFRNSDCPRHNSKVSAFKRQRELAGMLKVDVYNTDTPGAEFRSIQRGTFYYVIPVLLISDGEHLLGYCANESTHQEMGLIVKQAAEAMAWKRATRQALMNMDALIERKAYAQVATQLKTIEEQDLQLTKRLMATTKAQSDKARAEYAKRVGQPAPEEKPVEPPTEGQFFSKETTAARERLVAAIDTELKAVEALLESGEARKAGTALAPLLRLKVNEETDAKIKSVQEKVQEAVRAATAPKPASTPAESTPAPASATGSDS